MMQKGRHSGSLYFPQEIIRNILIRLPVKSLIRFKCVCKDWKNLIQNPSFIAGHLQQSSHQNPFLLFECHEINIPLRLLDCGLQFREVQKAPLIDSLGGACIFGSCNGLLLVEVNHYNPSLALWNPATTAVRHVPRARTNCFHLDNWVIGFGFSPIVNDYKIVRTYARLDDAVNRVEVFSLSRGSWKGIDVGNLKGVNLDVESVTTNGAIFWYGQKLGAKKEGKDNIEVKEDEDDMEEGEDDMEDGEDDVEVIVSFDIAKEVFTLIPSPNLGYGPDEMLTVYENKLAILCNIWEDDETVGLIDLWVLDEGTCVPGETWRWTKRYTSSPLSCRLNSITIWRNEIVCKPKSREGNEKGRNVLYLMNLSTNEVKRLVIPYCGHFPGIYDYVESLVSVGNNYIEESSS